MSLLSIVNFQALQFDQRSEVGFNNIRVSKDNVLGNIGEDWPIVEKVIERSSAAVCCDTIGVLQKVIEMTLGYTKERKQFEKPIGAFQVIQHYMADMITYVDSARFVTYQAAWQLGED